MGSRNSPIVRKVIAALKHGDDYQANTRPSRNEHYTFCIRVARVVIGHPDLFTVQMGITGERWRRAARSLTHPHSFFHCSRRFGASRSHPPLTRRLPTAELAPCCERRSGRSSYQPTDLRLCLSSHCLVMRLSCPNKCSFGSSPGSRHLV
jgi:hypothetical protein